MMSSCTCQGDDFDADYGFRGDVCACDFYGVYISLMESISVRSGAVLLAKFVRVRQTEIGAHPSMIIFHRRDVGSCQSAAPVAAGLFPSPL